MNTIFGKIAMGVNSVQKVMKENQDRYDSNQKNSNNRSRSSNMPLSRYTHGNAPNS